MQTAGTSALACLFRFLRLLGRPRFFFKGSFCLPPGDMPGCGYMYGWYGYA